MLFEIISEFSKKFDLAFSALHSPQALYSAFQMIAVIEPDIIKAFALFRSFS
jgi:hypothetical protein